MKPIFVRTQEAELEFSLTANATPGGDTPDEALLERRLQEPLRMSAVLDMHNVPVVEKVKPMSWYYTDGPQAPFAVQSVARRLLLQLWSQPSGYVYIEVCFLGGPAIGVRVKVNAGSDAARHTMRVLQQLHDVLSHRGITWLGDIGSPLSINIKE